IVEHQVNGRTQPWLLLLTTSVDDAEINTSDCDAYQELIVSNWKRSRHFREAMIAIVGDGLSVEDAAVDEQFFVGRDPASLGKLVSVGVGKWLMSLIRSPVPWKVELASCLFYSKGDGRKRQG